MAKVMAGFCIQSAAPENVADDACIPGPKKNKPGARLKAQIELTESILAKAKNEAPLSKDIFAEAIYDHIFTG